MHVRFGSVGLSLWIVAAAPAATVTVHPGGWGEAGPDDIQFLLQNVERTFYGVFWNPPTNHLDVYYDGDAPMVGHRRSIQEPAQIYLSATGQYWAQFAYQFGHELCHVACNYDRFRTPGDAPHPWMWFQEALCETASLFTLRRMADSWKNRPPDPAWKGYAPHLRDYARQVDADPERQLPPGVSLAEWYARHRPLLETNAANRSWNGLVANRLLPLFEANPRGWQAVRYLPLTRGQPSEYFRAWLSQTPRRYRKVVRAIAAEFGVAL